jgi:hypothetical protein
MKLGTLGYEKGKEEGTVKIDWVLMPEGAVRLDIIGDWIHELLHIYEKETDAVYSDKK